MINYTDLALKYGGFTSLDKVYLENKLAQLSSEQKLSFITPPPSVINAYFAEIYQKQSPEAATDYYFDLSKKLHLFESHPSFNEVNPFVRLNLSDKAYGFTYENEKEEALVFSERTEPITTSLLFELARVFPHYKIYVEGASLKMAKLAFDEEILEDITPQSSQLSSVLKLRGNVIKIKSFNQDELSDLLKNYKGQSFYGFEQREFIVYIKE